MAQRVGAAAREEERASDDGGEGGPHTRLIGRLGLEPDPSGVTSYVRSARSFALYSRFSAW
jgi:hypothetical protein